MIRAAEIRKGKVVLHEGTLYSVVDIDRVSKGNWRSYLQAKFKSIKTGQIVDVRLSPDDRLETPFVETKPFEYLYRDGQEFILMDQENFEQIHVSGDVMGEAELYLRGNEVVTCQFIDGALVAIELPNTVELKVVDTPPVMRGATVTNQTKDAQLETGLSVRVPPFIEIGEVLRIDTRTGEYLERAKS
ncbi:MAG: elongation factor P [Planctomycetia bacterium]|nr:MAG: elongation factor P [Planctomycetia bacterium]